MEKITAAAIRVVGGGMCFVGWCHDDIREQLKTTKQARSRTQDGFKTTKGRFVNRMVAGRLALAAKQVLASDLAVSNGELHSRVTAFAKGELFDGAVVGMEGWDPLTDSL